MTTIQAGTAIFLETGRMYPAETPFLTSGLVGAFVKTATGTARVFELLMSIHLVRDTGRVLFNLTADVNATLSNTGSCIYFCN